MICGEPFETKNTKTRLCPGCRKRRFNQASKVPELLYTDPIPERPPGDPHEYMRKQMEKTLAVHDAVMRSRRREKQT
jgi:hypothetical protein